MSQPISIAIHGGAGVKSGTYNESELLEFHRSLSETLETGVENLMSGESALNTVVKLCTLLEDNPIFNAGKGSVFNMEGEIEMDASVMDGSRAKGGGVTGIRDIKNPILGALAVLEHSPHTLLSGESAQRFCSSHGVELVDREYFKTEKRFLQFKEAQKNRRIQLEHEGGSTVGVVAKDSKGQLAAATSTGGMTFKYPGRVSDSSVVGAGTFANDLCAVSGTGTGDQFILGAIAHLVAMKRETLTLAGACNFALDQLASLDGRGGLIAVDKEGNVVCPFNTDGMFFGRYNQKTDEKEISP